MGSFFNQKTPAISRLNRGGTDMERVFKPLLRKLPKTVVLLH